MSEMADAIRALAEEKGISEDSIRQTVENTIKAAYKKTFGSADNCIVKFADDMSDVSVYARKVIVDGVYDPSLEIELEDALKLVDGCEVGDEIDVLVDPHDFERSAVTQGKQAAHQALSESFVQTLVKEYREKIGQVIIGYYQREYKGDIYLDLGKIEGKLPAKYQSPRETYEKNDRIKTLIVDIKPTKTGVQAILSRTDPKFVEAIVENEVPEIGEGIIGIHKVSREAGYRTKIAVYSNKIDVDPVGACVGLKGVRIQNVIRELEGEKIDVLRYDEDPHVFIKNALSPAEVSQVVILDAEKREALAIVPDSSFSLAIGKQGLNVRLANKLCDWTIDVKTEEEAADMDLSETDTRRAAEELFNSTEEVEEITTVSQLPGVDKEAAAKLKAAGIDDIEKFLEAYEDGSALRVEGINADDIEAINKIINESVEFEEEAAAQEEAAASQEDDSEEEYFCPECGAKITLDMTHCPKCGVEFSFVEE